LATHSAALSEAELAFLLDVLSWLCREGILGSLTTRRAMAALPRYDATEGAGPGKAIFRPVQTKVPLPAPEVRRSGDLAPCCQAGSGGGRSEDVTPRTV
jgi:hypothetical protein